MRRTKKWVFVVVVLIIAAMSYLAFFGLSTTHGDLTTRYIKGASDIRWGIDIRGGVDVTFSPPEGYDATNEEMAAAESIIKVRLVSQNITDYEVYTDFSKDRIIVRFPWKPDETDFNPEVAIQELGATAKLTFREGVEVDSEGKPTGTTKDTIVIEGKHVESASAVINSQNNQPVVSLKLTAEGAKLFADATGRLIGKPISIWMDETLISAPIVENKISEGEAMITGKFTVEEAKALADKINGGALPFSLQTDNYNSISPTLGQGAKDVMVLAGAIAFILVCAFMIIRYRVPGLVAAIALAGQVALMIASVTGFFDFIPSFTLTLPGIAGIILSIGFGVDANVITSERIKEEIRAGKTTEGAIHAGFERGFSAILDGNITVIIIAVVLMGTFGPPTSLFSKILSPLFAMFGPATAGSIYSFGYTLLVGVILNQVMGVFASRLMLTSICKFQAFKKPWLYGGVKNENN